MLLLTFSEKGSSLFLPVDDKAGNKHNAKDQSKKANDKLQPKIRENISDTKKASRINLILTTAMKPGINMMSQAMMRISSAPFLIF